MRAAVGESRTARFITASNGATVSPEVHLTDFGQRVYTPYFTIPTSTSLYFVMGVRGDAVIDPANPAEAGLARVRVIFQNSAGESRGYGFTFTPDVWTQVTTDILSVGLGPVVRIMLETLARYSSKELRMESSVLFYR